jgi:hypothetical protein
VSGVQRTSCAQWNRPLLIDVPHRNAGPCGTLSLPRFVERWVEQARRGHPGHFTHSLNTIALQLFAPDSELLQHSVVR